MSLAIGCWLEAFKGTYLQDILHQRQMQSRIDTDALETMHLVSIHTTHRGANDNVRLFLLNQLSQEGQSLKRFYWNVRSYHLSLRHQLT